MAKKMTITRKEVDLDQLFVEDINQYYEVAEAYLNLTTEDYSQAFELSKKAWVLADRWAAMASNAGKLAKLREGSKTDIYNYCYYKYRQLQELHTHTRMIWSKGEEGVKEKRIG